MNRGVSNSLFAMCRCTVALAYIDGVLSPEEKEMLQGFFATLPLSKEQEKTLADDLAQGNLDYYLLYKQITDLCDRAHLISFARVLFYSDGDFSKDEKAVLENMTKDHMNNVCDEKGQAVKPLSDMDVSKLVAGDGNGIDAGVSYLKDVVDPNDDW